MSPWVADCRTQAEPRLEQEGWGPSKGNVANSRGVSTSTLDCGLRTALTNEKTEQAPSAPHQRLGPKRL